MRVSGIYIVRLLCSDDLSELEKKDRDEYLGRITAPRPKILVGPGDYLHDAICRWTGEEQIKGCSCLGRIYQMNTWGPAGCRERINEIVEWLAEEANKRGWWRYAVAVPGSRYFIKRMVLGAIKKAESQSRFNQQPTIIGEV